MAKTALESPSKIQRIQVLTTERPVDSSAAKALDRSPPHRIQSIDVEEIMMQREGILEWLLLIWQMSGDIVLEEEIGRL